MPGHYLPLLVFYLIEIHTMCIVVLIYRISSAMMARNEMRYLEGEANETFGRQGTELALTRLAPPAYPETA